VGLISPHTPFYLRAREGEGVEGKRGEGKGGEGKRRGGRGEGEGERGRQAEGKGGKGGRLSITRIGGMITAALMTGIALECYVLRVI